MELLSTLEVICGEASLAAGLVAWPGGTWHGWWTRLSGTDLDSDLAGRHTCGLIKAQDLLLLAALIGQQAVLRVPQAVVVSLASIVGATLDALDSGGTSPTMRRSRKASRGSQLFELMLPRCTDVSSQHHEGLQTRTRSSVSFACPGPCRFHRLDPRHR